MAINDELFPGLKQDRYAITSDPDPRYNCLAWAAGFSDRVFDPSDQYDWPDDLPGNCDIGTVIMLFEGLGFDLCQDGDLEQGYEKVAIYGTDGEYNHAARQLPSGAWTSKMGIEDDDIEHPRAESVAGDYYGPIVAYLKREIKTG